MATHFRVVHGLLQILMSQVRTFTVKRSPIALSPRDEYMSSAIRTVLIFSKPNVDISIYT